MSVAVVTATPSLAERFAEVLRDHYDVRTVTVREVTPIAPPVAGDILLIDVSTADVATVIALRQDVIDERAPIIVFTTPRDHARGIAALNAGADELLTTRMPREEVVSRVRAAVRRRHGPRRVRPAVLRGGPIVVDLARRRAEINGAVVGLTSLELKLLSYFLIHADEPITRTRLMGAVWGYSIGSGATVTVHVRRLREKIEQDPSNPRLIRTVWGLGYQFISASATEEVDG